MDALSRLLFLLPPFRQQTKGPELIRKCNKKNRLTLWLKKCALLSPLASSETTTTTTCSSRQWEKDESVGRWERAKLSHKYQAHKCVSIFVFVSGLLDICITFREKREKYPSKKTDRFRRLSCKGVDIRRGVSETCLGYKYQVMIWRKKHPGIDTVASWSKVSWIRIGCEKNNFLDVCIGSSFGKM